MKVSWLVVMFEQVNYLVDRDLVFYLNEPNDEPLKIQ
jgi:hypothetical protein